MKTIFVFTIALFAFSAQSQDVLVCTQDVGILVNDLFIVVESFENDPFNPSADSLKQLLAGVQKFLNECAHIDIDLSPYAVCVDDGIKILPLIKKLIADIEAGSQSDIVLDVSSIALSVVNTVADCSKHSSLSIRF